MKTRIPRASAIVATAGLIALTACEDEVSPVQSLPDPEPETPNIVETAQAAGNFNTLIAALEVAELDDVLSGTGPFTVFAPTDEAFAQIPEDVISDLLADRELLTSVLTYHVVAGEVPASTVLGLNSAATLNGKEVEIEVDDGTVRLDGVRVITTDVHASNGIIHVIEGVLTPEPIANIVQTARSAGGFDTLLAAVEAAGLTDVLSGPGPFTVFAPTDEAFAQIPTETLNTLLADPAALAEILTYHVVVGQVLAADVVELDQAVTVNGAAVEISADQGAVSVNEANVVLTDVLARNGVIHVIDRVLIP